VALDPAVLDTDVGSRLQKGTLTGPLATRLIGREVLITFVTFGELSKWAEIRNWGERRRGELAAWLAKIAVLPGDEAVAATWGRLSAAATRRGRPRPWAWTNYRPSWRASGLPVCQARRQMSAISARAS
jgi:predicted nucleic acid-binding protein